MKEISERQESVVPQESEHIWKESVATSRRSGGAEEFWKRFRIVLEFHWNFYTQIT